ncbi:hypothetical protein [Conyzicola sp.]|uniref:hypothetical protein n=1 Tax=Conyzicola sp. TaxID=1969404 RepID=UPI003988C43C
MRSLTRPDPTLTLEPRRRADGSLPSWSRKRKSIEKFVAWALANQSDQCAICGYFVGDVADRRAWSIDHFAPKGDTLYPQWTFEPLNLIVTCHSCNSIFKQDFDSVTLVGRDYADSSFLLVHPYLDSIERHIEGTYAGRSRRVGAPRPQSPKGRTTIELFRLDDVNYLSGINRQALRISLDEWKAHLPGATLLLFKNAMAELTGRHQ